MINGLPRMKENIENKYSEQNLHIFVFIIWGNFGKIKLRWKVSVHMSEENLKVYLTLLLKWFW